MKDLKIIYDLKSCPNRLTMLEVLDIAKLNKIVLWDSELKGKEPKIVEDVNLETMDSSTEEGKELIEKYKLDL